MNNQSLINNIVQSYASPSVTISEMLLLNYSKIHMTDEELIFWLKLTYVSQYGQQPMDFNTWSNKLNLTLAQFLDLFNILENKGFITINEKKHINGIDTFVDFTPLYHILMPQVMVTHQEKNEKKQLSELFTAIEREFGRPLSSRDIEMINSWLDKDNLSIDLIMHALKEAVIAKKVSIKYIDRILFEWYKAGITSYEQIENHAKKYRPQNITKIVDQESPIEFINWLDGEE